MANLKKTHGGARKGAGRPTLPKSKKKESTKVMRVPVSKVKIVETLISNEGKKVLVDRDTFEQLMKDFQNGFWMAVVKSKGQPHVIILTENFQ